MIVSVATVPVYRSPLSSLIDDPRKQLFLSTSYIRSLGTYLYIANLHRDSCMIICVYNDNINDDNISSVLNFQHSVTYETQSASPLTNCRVLTYTCTETAATVATRDAGSNNEHTKLKYSLGISCSSLVTIQLQQQQ